MTLPENEWLPIEDYDRYIAKAPFKNRCLLNCVFLVEKCQSGRCILEQQITLERNYGFRKTTHFLILPALPDSKG